MKFKHPAHKKAFIALKTSYHVLLKPKIIKTFLENFIGQKNKIHDSIDHLEQTMKWLCRGQDICEGGGVSAAYSISMAKWLPPYPETTGYIIPTFIEYCKLSRNPDYKTRALAMADFEIDIQLPCGGIINGYYGDDDSNFFPKEKIPVVFNTGQVILGWCAVFQETKDTGYLDAAIRAANWIIGIQDDDGVWRRFLSPIPNGNPVHSYHTRVAWALLETYKLTKEIKFKTAAGSFLNWALAQQLKNGWFENANFFIGSPPLTHTLCYVAEGFLESFEILKNEEYFNAAYNFSERLMHCFEINETLPATIDKNWKSNDSYTCLTGDAQAACLWFRIYEITKDARFLNSALKMMDFLKSVHDISTSDLGIKGGLGGSYPIYGAYSYLNYPNWAAKFFADALMLELKEPLKNEQL